jgi:hypothetical protein
MTKRGNPLKNRDSLRMLGLSTLVTCIKIRASKVPRKFVDGKLYWHVHKKSKRIKTRMGTTVGLYNKKNEIIS